MILEKLLKCIRLVCHRGKSETIAGVLSSDTAKGERSAGASQQEPDRQPAVIIVRRDRPAHTLNKRAGDG